MGLYPVSLDDKYDLGKDHIFVSGTQALVRLALIQKERDRRAGLKSVPLEKGDQVSRSQIVAYLVMLLPVSLLPYSLGVAGPLYLGAAVLLGAAFLGFGAYGFARRLGGAWARQLFFTSILYLAGLFAVLMIDGGARA